MTRTRTIAALLATTFAFAASAQADESTISYSLVPGACSKPMAVPANNKPVILAGTHITAGNRGAGQVTLLRANSDPALLDWAGVDNVHGVESGSSATDYTRIMYLDSIGYVSVTVAPSTHIKVCNGSTNPAPRAIGYLTFVY
ncbi:MAG TPA: hypothetical protein VGM17_19065 [Rhizomicrobium sp.]|jgi:hypothetical protein